MEEALKMLAGALRDSLNPVLTGLKCSNYKLLPLFLKPTKNSVDYINYRKIETKLREKEELNAQLLKERSPSVPPQPNPTNMAGNAAEPPSA